MVSFISQEGSLLISLFDYHHLPSLRERIIMALIPGLPITQSTKMNYLRTQWQEMKTFSTNYHSLYIIISYVEIKSCEWRNDLKYARGGSWKE